MTAALEAVKDGQGVTNIGMPKSTLYNRVTGCVMDGTKLGSNLLVVTSIGTRDLRSNRLLNEP